MPTSDQPVSTFRNRAWKRFLHGPDQQLLDELYTPGLFRAMRYDRCCAYFSSSVLAAAARGFGALIERLSQLGALAPRPAVRLIVNEELDEADVRALTERGDDSRISAALAQRLREPADLLERERLAMLGWLVSETLLEVRVGVMRIGRGILHAKYGLMIDDRGDAIVFGGSGNESAYGLRSNYEEIEVTPSWTDPDRFDYYRSRFDAIWCGADPDVRTVSLPQALRERLIAFAPRDTNLVRLRSKGTEATERQRVAIMWQFLAASTYLQNGEVTCDATAYIDLWPHQQLVVDDTVAAWPEGRMLCDEVGMGKTIEAMLILRRLLAGRGVARALILLPAGLLVQWQQELLEKGGLEVPRLQGTQLLVWPNGREERVDGFGAALRKPIVLVSRELARLDDNRATVLASDPWDLVILDEAHAARRAKQIEGEFNSATLLLRLLRELQLKRRARSFLLLSATPMQTQPWEPWDLLSVLGEGGEWLAEFSNVRRFYRAAHSVLQGQCSYESARFVARTIGLDPAFPPPPLPSSAERPLAARLRFDPAPERDKLSRWMKRGAPLARRMHRNTRTTLRRYVELGMLERPPPKRRVADWRFDFGSVDERQTYDAITGYIDRRFRELEQERAGKGFVMTIYRRRTASSFAALQASLMRRRDGLQKVVDRAARFEYEEDATDPYGEREEGEGDELGRISSALPASPDGARRERTDVDHLLERLARLDNRDSKLDRLFESLRYLKQEARSTLIFTEYADTMIYLRNKLLGFYGSRLGCYSGDGGSLWNGERWESVDKETVTQLVQNDGLKLLICTDAASEGLNLQGAGSLINYDLPWNPSRVEQRIGRIDRIGQRHSEVVVLNLVLANSVDERVYQVLRERCGLFQHFVGRMQPVLSRARDILLGRMPNDLRPLLEEIERIEADPVIDAQFPEDEICVPAHEPPPLDWTGVRAALLALASLPEQGSRRVSDDVWEIGGLQGHFASHAEALGRGRPIRPLWLGSDDVRRIADGLVRPGERLPLVVESRQRGAFRRTVAVWVGEDHAEPIQNFKDLETRIKQWDGRQPSEHAWMAASNDASAAAESQVVKMSEQAVKRERLATERQITAARGRLLRELCRFLITAGGHNDVNARFHELLCRADATSARLKSCYDQLGGYPDWPTWMIEESVQHVAALSPNQQDGLLMGSPLDAALADPRWRVQLL